MEIVHQNEIENRIFTIRGVQVMLDSHLSEMYDVDNKRLNEQVKRNIVRFPDSFMFQLTDNEWEFLRSQIVTLKTGETLRSQNATLDDKRGKHRKYLPYVFTEQGIAMLSAVLRSDTAVMVSIKIMNAFVLMRKLALNNAGLFQRLDKIEVKQLETDRKFEQIFKAIESRTEPPDNAYVFVAELIKSAKKSIQLIDNYVDESVLLLLSKRPEKVSATIFTKQINKQLALDLKKHEAQYPAIEVKLFSDSHDRFLIIDEKELYHLGASLKDLGKKWFAFSKMDSLTKDLLAKLK